MTTQNEKTGYTVITYQDGVIVGHVELTDEQFAHYIEMSQKPEGIIRLGDMPHDYYNLYPQYQDLNPDTTIFLS